RFPLYGFGGKPQRGAAVSHCFAVNGNEADPEVTGVTGILQAYYQSLRVVELFGPTLFAPVINQAAAMAASLVTPDPRQSVKYCILLILTDGIINDMANTTDAIVAAAELPFSIIIVGVGNADFASMVELDGDDVRLTSSSGKKAVRDIVQFVPMREVSAKGPQALAKEVLSEIPSA
ncbi:copine-8, partial [Tribonema minus]